MALMRAVVFAAIGVFLATASEVKLCTKAGTKDNQTPATIFAPSAAGSYPVILFLHGFQCPKDAYTTMLQDIATEGFIVVAPQLSESLLDPNATPQIHQAAKFLEWLYPHLEPFIKSNCKGMEYTLPDVKQLVAMGHSKGGKIAFALARGIESNVNTLFSAVVGIDPVDGSSRMGGSTKPPVLSGTKFDLGYPTLLIGSGFGPQSKWFVLPPCAEKQYGYKAFFANSSAPVYEFWAKDDGHMDFLDDNLPFQVEVMAAMCKAGSRKRARGITSGITTAFLQAALQGKCDKFDSALEGPSYLNSYGTGTLCGKFASQ